MCTRPGPSWRAGCFPGPGLPRAGLPEAVFSSEEVLTGGGSRLPAPVVTPPSRFFPVCLDTRALRAGGHTIQEASSAFSGVKRVRRRGLSGPSAKTVTVVPGRASL